MQSRLRRTLDDIRDLADLKPSVRLCKGIYLEPRSIGYTHADEIRRSFVRCLDALLGTGSRVAVATHDEQLIGGGLVRDVQEFQMLLGVRGERARELVAAGHHVRVYVPFGEQWYAYALRRLQEHPAMARMIASATAKQYVRPRLRRSRSGTR